MRVRQAATMTVATSDDLERAEACLSSGEVDALVLDVPDGASVFMTAGDVRRVLHAARQAEVEVTFVTDDPLRSELIAILGGDVRLPREHARACDPPGNDELTRRIGYVGGVIRRPAGEQTNPTERIARDEPSFSFVITPPVTTRQPDPPAVRATPAVARPPTKPAKRSSCRRGKVAALVTALAIGAVAIGFAAAYILPKASVSLVPTVQDVSVEVTYGVDGSGGTWDIPIQPVVIDATLTASASQPTTGERVEPDGTAVGTLRLTNAATSEVFVPAGTIVASSTGIAFATAEDIVVPAADPFGSLTFGSAIVDIRATRPGPDGNVGAEEIVGQLDSGIFYTNLEPTSGGSSRRIQTVSQADVDALRARVTLELDSRSQIAIAERLAPGQQILAGSENRGAIELTFSHAVGADATELRVDATRRVSALAYSLDDVHAVARMRAAEEVADAAGAGYAVVPGSIVVSEPTPVTGASAPAFVVRAEAKAEAVISAETVEHLPDQLAGRGEADAMAFIRGMPGVAGATIETWPDWWPLGLPRRASQIEVSIVSAATDGTPTSSGP